MLDPYPAHAADALDREYRTHTCRLAANPALLRDRSHPTRAESQSPVEVGVDEKDTQDTHYRTVSGMGAVARKDAPTEASRSSKDCLKGDRDKAME